MKVQAHNSLEPPLEHNQDQAPLMNQDFYDLFNHPGSYRNIMCFRLVLEGKTGNGVTYLSGLQFLERFLANNFVLSDAEDNTPRLLNRRGIVDLPLLRTILAICQNSCDPYFWEESVVLLAYASWQLQDPFLNDY